MNLRCFLCGLITMGSAFLLIFLVWPWLGKWGAAAGLTLLFLLGG